MTIKYPHIRLGKGSTPLILKRIATPDSDTDAANKKYVDDLVDSEIIKGHIVNLTDSDYLFNLFQTDNRYVAELAEIADFARIGRFKASIANGAFHQVYSKGVVWLAAADNNVSNFYLNDEDLDGNVWNTDLIDAEDTLYVIHNNRSYKLTVESKQVAEGYIRLTLEEPESFTGIEHNDEVELIRAGLDVSVVLFDSDSNTLSINGVQYTDFHRGPILLDDIEFRTIDTPFTPQEIRLVGTGIFNSGQAEDSDQRFVYDSDFRATIAAPDWNNVDLINGEAGADALKLIRVNDLSEDRHRLVVVGTNGMIRHTNGDSETTNYTWFDASLEGDGSNENVDIDGDNTFYGVAHNGSNLVAVANHELILYSSDNGETWRKLSPSQMNIATPNVTLSAVSHDGDILIRTDDNHTWSNHGSGRHWNDLFLDSKGLPSNVNISELTGSDNDDDQIYVGFGKSTTNAKTAVLTWSTDQGETWNNSPDYLTTSYDGTDGYYYDVDTWTAGAFGEINVSDNDGDTSLDAEKGVIFVSNGGHIGYTLTSDLLQDDGEHVSDIERDDNNQAVHIRKLGEQSWVDITHGPTNSFGDDYWVAVGTPIAPGGEYTYEVDLPGLVIDNVNLTVAIPYDAVKDSISIAAWWMKGSVWDSEITGEDDYPSNWTVFGGQPGTGTQQQRADNLRGEININELPEIHRSTNVDLDGNEFDVTRVMTEEELAEVTIRPAKIVWGNNRFILFIDRWLGEHRIFTTFIELGISDAPTSASDWLLPTNSSNFGSDFKEDILDVAFTDRTNIPIEQRFFVVVSENKILKGRHNNPLILWSEHDNNWGITQVHWDYENEKLLGFGTEGIYESTDGTSWSLVEFRREESGNNLYRDVVTFKDRFLTAGQVTNGEASIRVSSNSSGTAWENPYGIFIGSNNSAGFIKLAASENRVIGLLDGPNRNSIWYTDELGIDQGSWTKITLHNDNDFIVHDAVFGNNQWAFLCELNDTFFVYYADGENWTSVTNIIVQGSESGLEGHNWRNIDYVNDVFVITGEDNIIQYSPTLEPDYDASEDKIWRKNFNLPDSDWSSVVFTDYRLVAAGSDRKTAVSDEFVRPSHKFTLTDINEEVTVNYLEGENHEESRDRAFEALKEALEDWPYHAIGTDSDGSGGSLISIRVTNAITQPTYTVENLNADGLPNFTLGYETDLRVLTFKNTIVTVGDVEWTAPYGTKDSELFNYLNTLDSDGNGLVFASDSDANAIQITTTKDDGPVSPDDFLAKYTSVVSEPVDGIPSPADFEFTANVISEYVEPEFIRNDLAHFRALYDSEWVKETQINAEYVKSLADSDFIQSAVDSDFIRFDSDGNTLYIRGEEFTGFRTVDQAQLVEDLTNDQEFIDDISAGIVLEHDSDVVFHVKELSTDKYKFFTRFDQLTVNGMFQETDITDKFNTIQTIVHDNSAGAFSNDASFTFTPGATVVFELYDSELNENFTFKFSADSEDHIYRFEQDAEIWLFYNLKQHLTVGNVDDLVDDRIYRKRTHGSFAGYELISVKEYPYGWKVATDHALEELTNLIPNIVDSDVTGKFVSVQRISGDPNVIRLEAHGDGISAYDILPRGTRLTGHTTHNGVAQYNFTIPDWDSEIINKFTLNSGEPEAITIFEFEISSEAQVYEYSTHNQGFTTDYNNVHDKYLGTNRFWIHAHGTGAEAAASVDFVRKLVHDTTEAAKVTFQESSTSDPLQLHSIKDSDGTLVFTFGDSDDHTATFQGGLGGGITDLDSEVVYSVPGLSSDDRKATTTNYYLINDELVQQDVTDLFDDVQWQGYDHVANPETLNLTPKSGDDTFEFGKHVTVRVTVEDEDHGTIVFEVHSDSEDHLNNHFDIDNYQFQNVGVDNILQGDPQSDRIYRETGSNTITSIIQYAKPTFTVTESKFNEEIEDIKEITDEFDLYSDEIGLRTHTRSQDNLYRVADREFVEYKLNPNLYDTFVYQEKDSEIKVLDSESEVRNADSSEKVFSLHTSSSYRATDISIKNAVDHDFVNGLPGYMEDSEGVKYYFTVIREHVIDPMHHYTRWSLDWREDYSNGTDDYWAPAFVKDEDNNIKIFTTDRPIRQEDLDEVAERTITLNEVPMSLGGNYFTAEFNDHTLVGEWSRRTTNGLSVEQTADRWYLNFVDGGGELDPHPPLYRFVFNDVDSSNETVITNTLRNRLLKTGSTFIITYSDTQYYFTVYDDGELYHQEQGTHIVGTLDHIAGDDSELAFRNITTDADVPIEMSVTNFDVGSVIFKDSESGPSGNLHEIYKKADGSVVFVYGNGDSEEVSSNVTVQEGNSSELSGKFITNTELHGSTFRFDLENYHFDSEGLTYYDTSTGVNRFDSEIEQIVYDTAGNVNITFAPGFNPSDTIDDERSILLDLSETGSDPLKIAYNVEDKSNTGDSNQYIWRFTLSDQRVAISTPSGAVTYDENSTIKIYDVSKFVDVVTKWHIDDIKADLDSDISDINTRIDNLNNHGQGDIEGFIDSDHVYDYFPTVRRDSDVNVLIDAKIVPVDSDINSLEDRVAELEVFEQYQSVWADGHDTTVRTDTLVATNQIGFNTTTDVVTINYHYDGDTPPGETDNGNMTKSVFDALVDLKNAGGNHTIQYEIVYQDPDDPFSYERGVYRSVGDVSIDLGDTRFFINGFDFTPLYGDNPLHNISDSTSGFHISILITDIEVQHFDGKHDGPVRHVHEDQRTDDYFISGRGHAVHLPVTEEEYTALKNEDSDLGVRIDGIDSDIHNGDWVFENPVKRVALDNPDVVADDWRNLLNLGDLHNDEVLKLVKGYAYLGDWTFLDYDGSFSLNDTTDNRGHFTFSESRGRPDNSAEGYFVDTLADYNHTRIFLPVQDADGNAIGVNYFAEGDVILFKRANGDTVFMRIDSSNGLNGDSADGIETFDYDVSFVTYENTTPDDFSYNDLVYVTDKTFPAFSVGDPIAYRGPVWDSEEVVKIYHLSHGEIGAIDVTKTEVIDTSTDNVIVIGDTDDEIRLGRATDSEDDDRQIADKGYVDSVDSDRKDYIDKLNQIKYIDVYPGNNAENADAGTNNNSIAIGPGASTNHSGQASFADGQVTHVLLPGDSTANITNVTNAFNSDQEGSILFDKTTKDFKGWDGSNLVTFSSGFDDAYIKFGTSTDSDAVASGADSFALGGRARAEGSQSGAIGNGAFASNQQSIAIGTDSTANNYRGTAIGYRAGNGGFGYDLGYRGTSIGYESSSRGHSSSSFGVIAKAWCGSGIAIGRFSQAGSGSDSDNNNQDANHIAIGRGAEAGNSNGLNDALAIGTGATASHNYTIAIGTGADATTWSAIAIGRDATASHTNSVAIGRGATTTGTNQVTFAGGDIDYVTLPFRSSSDPDPSIPNSANGMFVQGDSLKIEINGTLYSVTLTED